MQVITSTPADVPRALLMAALLLALGAFAILWPQKIVASVESLASATQEFRGRLTGEPTIWQSNRMPLSLVRFTLGIVGIGGAALCAYIAYIGLSR